MIEPPLASVEVRRSRRRTRTVSARREGDLTIISIPARFSAAQEREWVSRMVARLDAKERRRRPSDVDLERRARELSTRHLGGQARIGSVRWSDAQGKRWGSCTVATGDIRISTRLRGMPGWVLDYVLVHELGHTIVAGHTPEFWALVEAYPRAERARGFLEGVSFGRDGDTGEVPRPGESSAAAEDPAEALSEWRSDRRSEEQ